MSEKSTYEDDFFECYELCSEGNISKEQALIRLENKWEKHFKWKITEEQIHEYEKLKEKYPLHFNPGADDYEVMLEGIEEIPCEYEQVKTINRYDEDLYRIFKISDKSKGYNAQKLYADTKLRIENFQNANLQNAPQFSPAENKTVSGQPEYIKELIDKGLVDNDMKVLKSLDEVALYIAKNCGINLSQKHLDCFITRKGKKYSPSAKKQAVNHALN